MPTGRRDSEERAWSAALRARFAAAHYAAADRGLEGAAAVSAALEPEMRLRGIEPRATRVHAAWVASAEARATRGVALVRAWRRRSRVT
jgi:hypothetical protein